MPAIPPFVIDFLGGNHFDYLFGIFRWVGLLRWLLCSLARIGSSSRTESLDADKQEWGQATSVLGNHHLHPTLGGAASAHRTKLWSSNSMAARAADMQVVSPLVRGSLAIREPLHC